MYSWLINLVSPYIFARPRVTFQSKNPVRCFIENFIFILHKISFINRDLILSPVIL